jgi:hypothetical protein
MHTPTPKTSNAPTAAIQPSRSLLQDIPNLLKNSHELLMSVRVHNCLVWLMLNHIQGIKDGRVTISGRAG